MISGILGGLVAICPQANINSGNVEMAEMADFQLNSQLCRFGNQELPFLKFYSKRAHNSGSVLFSDDVNFENENSELMECSEMVINKNSSVSHSLAW